MKREGVRGGSGDSRSLRRLLGAGAVRKTPLKGHFRIYNDKRGLWCSRLALKSSIFRAGPIDAVTVNEIELEGLAVRQ